MTPAFYSTCCPLLALFLCPRIPWYQQISSGRPVREEKAMTTQELRNKHHHKMQLSCLHQYLAIVNMNSDTSTLQPSFQSCDMVLILHHCLGYRISIIVLHCKIEQCIPMVTGESCKVQHYSHHCRNSMYQTGHQKM